MAWLRTERDQVLGVTFLGLVLTHRNHMVNLHLVIPSTGGAVGVLLQMLSTDAGPAAGTEEEEREEAEHYHFTFAAQ